MVKSIRAPKGAIVRKNPLIADGGTNAKLHKSNESDSMYKSSIMYLAPATSVSGVNLCPMAVTAGCEKACLFTAGRGAFTNVENARIAKTELFRDDLEQFMSILFADCARILRKAKKNGYIPAIRLNGTSDILWENIPFNGYANIFAAFPEITFYDYSKNISKARSAKIAMIPNYSITASYSEVSLAYAHKIADQSEHNIAVVFNTKNLPEFFTLANGKTLPVINGDISDERYLDPTDKQYIVGLVAKGKAKKDTSGFVIDASRQLIAMAA